MQVHFLRYANHWTASSSAEWSLDKQQSSLVKGHELTVWDIVWVSATGAQVLSLLDSVISVYSRHSSQAVQYGNDSAETTVVEVGQGHIVR